MLSNAKIVLVAMGFVLAGCAGISGTQRGDAEQSSITDTLASAVFSRFFFGRGRAASSGANIEVEASYYGHKKWRIKKSECRLQLAALMYGFQKL